MAYAAEPRRTTVRVNLIDPGPLRTRLRAQAYPGEDAGKLTEPGAVTDAFVALAETACAEHGQLIDAAPRAPAVLPETIETKNPGSDIEMKSGPATGRAPTSEEGRAQLG